MLDHTQPRLEALESVDDGLYAFQDYRGLISKGQAEVSLAMNSVRAARDRHNAGLSQTALICANCGVKLRLASEKSRDLQIDPWIHEAMANILRGRNR